MTRRRRIFLVLRVCIGTCLLLCSAIIVDAGNGPAVSSGKTLAANATGALAFEETRTFLKTSDQLRNESIDDSLTKEDPGTVQSEFSKGAETGVEEKVAIPIDNDSEVQAIRSRDEVDRLSTSNSTNGGTRFEESLYGTSGKSSSTKTIFEDASRLARTNDLTTATAKPALEESRFEDKKNKTISGDEKVDLGYLARESTVNSGWTLEPTEEPPTRKALPLESFLERRKKADLKNSEVADLKGAEDRKENGGSVSLINDTYVNYSQHYKTTTERSLEAGLGNQSGAYENATNFISEDGTVTHEPQDPKGEVEVVGNVTHDVIQRITERQPGSSPINGSAFDEWGGEGSNRNKDSISSDTRNERERVKEKLAGATTEKMKSEERSTGQGASSPVPRGRTIGFSGINEFPSVETKPTLPSKINIIHSRKNVKEQLRNSSARLEDTTEEASALENTISRGQLEEKYVDSEPSVVIENSIQQSKPSINENLINDTSNNTTAEARTRVQMTTMSLVMEEGKPANETAVDKLNGRETITKSVEKSTSTGNDIPQRSESHQVITERGSLDVTGNGITEVSLKAENERPFRETANRTTMVALTTESPDKPRTDPKQFSNADVQTSVEGSLLTRSTLNVTELSSTEYPLMKGNSSQVEGSTMPITLPLDITTKTSDVSSTSESVTESPETLDANGTNEIPSGGTFDPETFMPSTTTIEYEFVGLSETTTFLSQNVTEEPTEDHSSRNDSVTIASTIQDSTAETVTDSPSTGGTEVTSTEEISSVSMTDQTIVPTSIPSPTESVDEFTTESTIVDERTEQSTEGAERARAVTDSVVTDSDAPSTLRTEQPSTSTTKESAVILNITQVPTSTANVSVLTDATRMPTSSPVGPTTPRSRIAQSASDVPMEATDDTKMSSSPEEITSVVHIVMEGSWHDVCPHMETVRATLAKILWLGMNKSVDAKQIRFHQDIPCPEPPNSTPTSSDNFTSIKVYVVDENERYNSTMTNLLPKLYNESPDLVKFPVRIQSFLLVQETVPDSGNAIAVVVVSSVAFICLVLLAGLLFIMRKRQTRFNYGERCRPVSLDAYSLDSVSAYNSVRRKGAARSSKRSYGNPTFEDSTAIPSHPLNFAGLSSFCNDVSAIDEEFAGIPQVSAKIDELPAGAEVKNRYANVIPLPETRVPLQKINNDPLSEYINASYVRGPKNATRYYIACQAPLDSTVTDFWRMIWEQQCKVIIMLTDLVENGVEKCTEYIPPSEITDCHRLYGDFQVTLKKRETKEKYAISTLHLKNLENNTFREVYHIWYLWPVNGAQSDGAGLIAVLLEARALQRGGPGPIVVHCSPGTGRTGTLIALDLGIRQYEITRTVDVPRVVYTIRRDRAGAVQTKEQYAFIYKALNLYATKLAGGVLESA